MSLTFPENRRRQQQQQQEEEEEEEEEGDGNPPTSLPLSTPPLTKSQKREAGGEQNLSGHLCRYGQRDSSDMEESDPHQQVGSAA
ncbi:hypothetical protein FQA47_004218 [Oryzias melastigma]|uniref:Uncharacterized protein n=1 Tax=Oryzias melastigma TaxID=30732 RepID=A0A834FEW7_ORYME|nr:hypothetical protein FQA47_004218 [Oryzias melastigma]